MENWSRIFTVIFKEENSEPPDKICIMCARNVHNVWVRELPSKTQSRQQYKWAQRLSNDGTVVPALGQR